MKTPLLSRHSCRGSALVTVMMLAVGLMIIIASILSYSLSERRLNYREGMRLEARNAAEAVSEYGLSQVRALMEARSNYAPTRFTSNESQVALPPTSFWTGGNVPTTGANAPEMIVGVIAPITQSTASGLFYYNPNDPDNAYDPLKGCYAFRFDVRVISKATVVPPAGGAGGPQTCYMTQTLSARASPLFSRAIFYNMDLELYPGPTMNILGAVHTNGNFFIRKNSSNGASINFVGPVTVAGGLYAHAKWPVVNADGSSDDLTSGADNVNFTNAAGGLVPLKNTTTSLWQDHWWGTTGETAATQTSFRTYWAQNSQGNLQTKAMGVQTMNPPGISTYVEDPTPGNGVDNSINSAHLMIEPPLLSTDAGYSSDVEAQKYSTRCGIYICVNTTRSARNGRMPNGTVISIPGYGTTVAGVAGFPDNRFHYRCFTKSGIEITLPGQPDYGTGNLTANTNANLAGPVVIKIRENEMYDLRRANFGSVTTRSAASPYSPKQITLIDLDMTALEFAVAKTFNGATTANVYNTGPGVAGAVNCIAGPIANGTATSSVLWTSYIYNPSATPTNVNTGATHNIWDTANNVALTSTYWNGGIYIESIDANQMPKLADNVTNNPNYRNGGLNNTSVFYAGSLTGGPSGVRLINGRGKVASNTAGDGLTIATNDAVYVLGHYNADGTIDSSTTGTTNSGRYPEAGEVPCSVCCDAMTVLSQPVFTLTGSPTVLAQTSGWNDGLSIMRMSSSGNIAAWRTTSPSGSNSVDGDGATGSTNPTATVWRVPYDITITANPLSTTATQKLGGSGTEISSAFMAGIVISNKNANNQNSGGAHNYPRFLESYSATVAIRGSIVAMFESRAATEPFNLRVYGPPTRLWGFNQLFANGTFPPLTPVVMSYRRIDFNDIDKTTYNSVKTSWGL